MTKSPPKTDLSLIVLNYNSHEYLSGCIQSLINSDYANYQVELIIVDNASTDNSFKNIININNTNKNLYLKTLKLTKNIGFSAGNNRGIKISSPSSRYIIFINPDTISNPDTIANMTKYLDNRPDISAATCYVKLALTGQLQPECHRGFPTPINTFWHFFGFGLPKLFPKSEFFNGYFMGHLDYSQPQKIDCCVGAFLMVRRQVGQSINWWNEKYFMYGEDLDFCYQLKKHNFNLYYIPFWQITHYQGVSSGIISHSQKLTKADKSTKIRSAQATVTAMRIFYENNLIKNYPPILRLVILTGIKLLETIRLIKAKYL